MEFPFKFLDHKFTIISSDDTIFLIQDVYCRNKATISIAKSGGGGISCRPQVNEPWSVVNRISGVPQLYPSDVKSAMFSGTLWSREPDLQIYSIAQCASHIYGRAYSGFTALYMNIYMYRLSYERRGDISFIARETMSYFVIFNLFITYLCLYLEQNPDYIFKWFILRVHFKMNSMNCLKYAKVEITKTNQK